MPRILLLIRSTHQREILGDPSLPGTVVRLPMVYGMEIVVLREEAMPTHLRMPANLAQHWIADTTRLRRELGAGDRTTRRDAVRETVEWERSHPLGEINPHEFDYAAEDAAVQYR